MDINTMEMVIFYNCVQRWKKSEIFSKTIYIISDNQLVY